MSAPARAEAFVLAWARYYTRDVPGVVADRRLLELASDCWEQRRRGREIGAHPWGVATSLVVRTLAGIPADLAWRHQARAVQGRPLHEGGRPMGRWLKDNWWVALGGLMGGFTTVLGIGLPFEDRTVGAAIGGTVIAILGLTALAGTFVRRRPGRRRAGDLMIAVGQMPWIPFFWTVVPPILALVVIVAAFMDLADAESTGSDSVGGAPTTRGGGVTVGLLALLVVAVGAAVVVREPGMVLAVPTPLAVALLVHLGLGRRLAQAPLLRTAAVLLTTPVLWFLAIAVIGELDDGYAVEGGWEYVVESFGIAMLVLGVALAVVGTFRGRQARSA